ncbi:MAG: MFS transporter [Candidatus Bathyarchaeota archaeon]
MNVKILLVTCAFLSLSMGVAYPFLSEYIYSITGCVVTVGIISSVRSVTSILFLVLGGFLSDSIGRKKPIYIGTFLLSFSQVMYGLARDFPSFILAAVCEGISYFYFPAFNAMIMDSTAPTRLVNTFTLALIADHLPYTISPILGGFLRDLYGVFGLKLGFIFSGIVMFLTALIRWLFITETVGKVNVFNTKMLFKAYMYMFKDFLGLSSLVRWLVLLRSFILLFAVSMFYYYAVLYAVRYTGSISFTGWGLIVAASSASYLASLPLANIVSRFKLTLQYPFLVFLEALASLLFILNSWIAFLVSMLILNVCGALTYAIERTVVCGLTEQTMRGRAEGFMSLSFYVGASLGSFIGGYVYSLHPPTLIILTSTLLIIGAFLGFILLKSFQIDFA